MGRHVKRTGEAASASWEERGEGEQPKRARRRNAKVKIVNLGVHADRINEHSCIEQLAGDEPRQEPHTPDAEDAARIDQAPAAEQFNLQRSRKVHTDPSLGRVKGDADVAVAVQARAVLRKRDVAATRDAIIAVGEEDAEVSVLIGDECPVRKSGEADRREVPYSRDPLILVGEFHKAAKDHPIPRPGHYGRSHQSGRLSQSHGSSHFSWSILGRGWARHT